jgi:hypothetical protein
MEHTFCLERSVLKVTVHIKAQTAGHKSACPAVVETEGGPVKTWSKSQGLRVWSCGTPAKVNIECCKFTLSSFIAARFQRA